MASKASIKEVEQAVNKACTKGYSCKYVSWEDAQRGTVGGGLSCWGGNITDVRLYEKTGKQLFTVRSNNWNEKLGKVAADEVAIVVPDDTAPPGANQLKPITLGDFLRNTGKYAAYAGVDAATSLYDDNLDKEVSIRFQTTFLPVEDKQYGAMEFCSENYNYNTDSDDNPRNCLLMATTQGIAFQQDGRGAKKLYHHSTDANSNVQQHWFEAERSTHKVGGAQVETEEEKSAAAQRGKATSSVIGIQAMGTRFNALLSIQIPVQQKKPVRRQQGSSSYAFNCLSLGSTPKNQGGMLLGSAMPASSYECCDMLSDASSSMSCDDLFDQISEVSEIASSLTCNEINDQSVHLDCLCPASSPLSKFKMADVKKRRAGPKKGTANAARVSKGSNAGVFKGVKVAAPKRDNHQHLTITVVLYNTVAGGVPSAEDVQAAIADMEKLYAACRWRGKLAEPGADFMKKELTVDNMLTISKKAPFHPAVVVNSNVFPTSMIT